MDVSEAAREFLDTAPSVAMLALGAGVGWWPRMRTVPTWRICSAVALAAFAVALVLVILLDAPRVLLAGLPLWATFGCFGARRPAKPDRPTPTGSVGPASRAFTRSKR